MAGKQLRLFLVDGNPGGLTTLEITNWTGRLVSAPRSELARLVDREETRKPGVYLLLGEDQAAVDGLRVYVGETDEIRTRLRQHHDAVRGKDFWTRVVIITSKDDNLTKGHIRYLESRLLRLATTAHRCTLENGNAPVQSPLPEGDQSDMEYFIEQLHIALPVLNVNVLRGAPEPTKSSQVQSQSSSPIFEIRQVKRGIHARAQQVDGEFMLLEGSVVAPNVSASDGYAPATQAAYSAYQSLRDKLVADGSISIVGDEARVTRDVVLASPSTAGAIALGRSCNGRREWRTAEGSSFAQWEERGLDSVSGEE